MYKIEVNSISKYLTSRVDKLTLTPGFSFGDIQDRKLFHWKLNINHIRYHNNTWNNCERAFSTFGLVVGTGFPLLAHYTGLVFYTLCWTSGADIAKRSRVSGTIFVRVTMTLSTYKSNNLYVEYPSLHMQSPWPLQIFPFFERQVSVLRGHSQAGPVKPSLQWQVPQTHSPFPPQSFRSCRGQLKLSHSPKVV